ncbi:mCG54937, isoform CRA_b [Mus musculus]|nr:mCG54937, isoform CRA_b [Mus musculus]
MGPPRAAGSWPTPAVPSSTMGFEDTRQLPTPEERLVLGFTGMLVSWLDFLEGVDSRQGFSM